jgi:hypothetical protein
VSGEVQVEEEVPRRSCGWRLGFNPLRSHDDAAGSGFLVPGGTENVIEDCGATGS